MNIKRFLKLENRKIAVIFIVGAIYFSAVFLAKLITPFLGGTALAPILGIIFWGIIYFIVVLPVAALPFSADLIASSILLKLFSTIILALWWYVISCAAVFIYDKIKTQKWIK